MMWEEIEGMRSNPIASCTIINIVCDFMVREREALLENYICKKGRIEDE